MRSESIYEIWIVEWCSSGDQRGQFRVTQLGDILRTNMQVFSGVRPPRFAERWLIVGAFDSGEAAESWSEKLRQAQELGQMGGYTNDDRIVVPPIIDVIGKIRLKSMPYEEYRQTDYWQKVRKEVLKRALYRCQLCGEDSPLDVHHRTYATRGEERTSDVIALCRDCHSKFHEVEANHG
jgi:hypothetical protein